MVTIWIDHFATATTVRLESLLPSRRANSILATSLSMKRPSWWDGIACSHCDEVPVHDARIRARSVEPLDSIFSLYAYSTWRVSQAFCEDLTGSVGVRSAGYSSRMKIDLVLKMFGLAIYRMKPENCCDWYAVEFCCFIKYVEITEVRNYFFSLVFKSLHCLFPREGKYVCSSFGIEIYHFRGCSKNAWRRVMSKLSP